MILNQKVRYGHSSMEDEKATSYSIMARSSDYIKAYKKYISIIKKYSELTGKENLNILNLGYGPGILENIILNEFESIKFISIDNSNTFKDICISLNSNFISNRSLELFHFDLNDKFSLNTKFDILISRDLNHHLNNLENYLTHCYNLMMDNSILIMEDLRYDAEIDGIHDFSELIFNINELKNDRWNLYHKMLGLYESFAASYLTNDILSIIQRSDTLSFRFKESKTRYHFVIYKKTEYTKFIDQIIEKLINI